MRSLLVSIALVLIGTPAHPAADDKKKDEDLLQGTWVMVALEVEGKLVPENKVANTMLEIKGNKYITKIKDRSFETTFTLDAAKKPKTIDMIFLDGEKKDKVLKGIYSIDGDTLKICRGMQPNQDRPSELGTWPGTNTFLVTWKRKK